MSIVSPNKIPQNSAPSRHDLLIALDKFAEHLSAQIAKTKLDRVDPKKIAKIAKIEEIVEIEEITKIAKIAKIAEIAEILAFSADCKSFEQKKGAFYSPIKYRFPTQTFRHFMTFGPRGTVSDRYFAAAKKTSHSQSFTQMPLSDEVFKELKIQRDKIKTFKGAISRNQELFHRIREIFDHTVACIKLYTLCNYRRIGSRESAISALIELDKSHAAFNFNPNAFDSIELPLDGSDSAESEGSFDELPVMYGGTTVLEDYLSDNGPDLSFKSGNPNADGLTSLQQLYSKYALTKKIRQFINNSSSTNHTESKESKEVCTQATVGEFSASQRVVINKNSSDKELAKVSDIIENIQSHIMRWQLELDCLQNKTEDVEITLKRFGARRVLPIGYGNLIIGESSLLVPFIVPGKAKPLSAYANLVKSDRPMQPQKTKKLLLVFSKIIENLQQYSKDIQNALKESGLEESLGKPTTA